MITFATLLLSSAICFVLGLAVSIYICWRKMEKSSGKDFAEIRELNIKAWTCVERFMIARLSEEDQRIFLTQYAPILNELKTVNNE